ncbi:hypothetical protein GP486_004609 [Trichoglossum hirsutum]|uniref:Uncharacterized protein n=1 Tax=Trichoglossum hirsutum TaxID=265104 RepID=A0A9P8LB07_9PEZI|nr:hypothetical protein GP486_004609 [Trichoglossum hirsutum]
MGRCYAWDHSNGMHHSFRLPSGEVRHLTIKERTVAILFRSGVLVWNFDSQSSRGITLNSVDRDYRLLLLSPFEDCVIVFSRSRRGDMSYSTINFDKYTFDGMLLTSYSLETRNPPTIQLGHWHIQPRDHNGLFAVVSRPCMDTQMTHLVQFDSRRNRLFSEEIPGTSDFRILWKDILISTNYQNNSLLITDLEGNHGTTCQEFRRINSTPEFSQISHDDLSRTGVLRPVCGLIGDESFLIFCWHDSFLKRPGAANIPIQAIGLSLYEKIGTDDPVEEAGTKVTRTQWLDLGSLEMANLIGKNILIVDEVDDTRTTLEYAVKELEKDVNIMQKKLGREGEKTQFSIFVLHNKDKPKKGNLPQEMLDGDRYLAARTVGDIWICYPWEAIDIDEHDRLAAEQQ